MSFWLMGLLNGVSFSALLFLISIGFSLIFGFMKIINISHASLYVLGAYIGIHVQAYTGNFLLAVLAAAVSAAIVGFLQERFLLRRFHGKELEQVLLTIGLMFVLDDVMLVIWGGYAKSANVPDALGGGVSLLGTTYPSYRLAVIVIGIVAAIILWFLIERTKIGALIRAGADNEEMAKAIGININKAFLAVFALGALIAGIGGIIGAPVFAVQPGASLEVLTLALVIVTIGGSGTIAGVAIGSLLIGLVDSFGRVLFPSITYFTIFLPMAVILIVRPQGLLGRSTK